MTNDDIIRMAREAGMPMAWISDSGVLNWADLLAFAALVAKHEREECAKVCEDASTPPVGEMLTDGQWASKILAGKIRARGNT